MQSDRYPVRIPRIGVAVIVTVPYARTNERHELSLSFRNGEGRYLPVGGAYPAAKPGSPPGALAGMTGATAAGGSWRIGQSLIMIAEKSGDSAPAMHGSFLKIRG